MKKWTIRFWAAFTAVSILSGCDAILEVEPQSNITDEVYFRNESDFEPNVVGIYTVVRSLANNVTYGTERGEELVSANNSRFTVAWSHTLSPTSGALNYAEWYRGIGHCNLILEKIQAFPFASNPDLKKTIQAEAHAMRAWFYFHLTRVIGDAAIMLQAVVDDNVPELPRSPATAVMTQILADIDAASQLYTSMNSFSKTSYPSRYRFSYGAVMAMKADALMWQAKVLGGGNASLEAALDAIAEVEATGLRLNPIFEDVTKKRAKDNPEVIMAAFYHRDEMPGGNYGKNALPYESILGGVINIDSIPWVYQSGNGQGAYQISPLSRSLFTNTADVRIRCTWVTEIHADGPKVSWIRKMPGTKYPDDRISDNDVIIYRLADILLLKAEAHAALNQGSLAKAALDQVRLRAGTGEYTGALDKSSLEREILNERGRELYFENKRWWDLVRFHKGGTLDIYQYIPNLIGKTTPLFWPLNTTVLANNPKIDQTEGYK
ncbi:RagB/SusD family nutrient uptake outer membrane protein [Chitinophaga sp.]|uniref:RagB/SusD family nutrient uptake outer membrane protein n=1 Tax=Chitinophaga sp. TaxID=1869181 RepID=UPI002602E34B|nr:RagB/SusD family nutrient uptake outer membrane protein [uncultured Chitinophaga sp.]